MNSISIVISAWNEEIKITKTLESVKWANEIILIDNESTDNTVLIAKQYNAKVFTQKNKPMLNENKNFGFTKANSDWILNLDADEIIPLALAKEILVNLTQSQGVDGYWIPRKNIIFGKWIRHGLWWPDKQLRLFRRNKGKFACNYVHEYLEVNGITKELNEPFIHNNYETISQYLRKMDTIYTQDEVKRQIQFGYQFAWQDAIKYPVSDFLKIYFAQEGYKDGLHGLVLAILQGFYSFVVFAKLWEYNKFKDVNISMTSFETDVKKSRREFDYWTSTTKINKATNVLEKIWFKIIRIIYGKT